MIPQTATRIHAIPCSFMHPRPSPSMSIAIQPLQSRGAFWISQSARRPSTTAFRSLFSISIPSSLRSFRSGEERSREATGRRGGAAFISSSSAKASSPEEAFVNETVSSHDIVIFSKTYCPYCSAAKAVFNELKKVPFVVELDNREDGQDIQDALVKIVGRRTVPQVFIKGNHLGGSDDTVEAYESGRLAELLGV